MKNYNIVNISYVLSKNRIDADFYKDKDVKLESFLSKVCGSYKLKDFVFEIQERFNPKTCNIFQYNDIGNTDIYNGTIKENIIQSKNAPGRATFINKKDDILISSVRPNRNANAIVNTKSILQVGSNGFCNVRTKGLNPNYIYIFTKTRYFIDILVRATTSSMYPAVSNKDILNVPFFVPSEIEILNISSKVENARKLLLDSQTLYQQATALLEQELGLDKISFEKTKGYTAKFSEVVETIRLDSNHYQPKFEQLLSHLKANFECKKIGYLVSCNRRGLQPKYVENGEIDVINSKHITSTHLKYDNFEKTTVDDFKSSIVAQVQEGDVLIYTTGAYVGLTNVYLSNKPALASNHVNILRLKDSEIDSTYIALVLNTTIGKLQTEKHIRGSAQAELYPNDISKFIVPLLSKEKMTEIGNLVRSSLKASQQSKQLLEEAKNRVEQLIEAAANQ